MVTISIHKISLPPAVLKNVPLCDYFTNGFANDVIKKIYFYSRLSRLLAVLQNVLGSSQPSPSLDCTRNGIHSKMLANHFSNQTLGRPLMVGQWENDSFLQRNLELGSLFTGLVVELCRTGNYTDLNGRAELLTDCN